MAFPIFLFNNIYQQLFNNFSNSPNAIHIMQVFINYKSKSIRNDFF